MICWGPGGGGAAFFRVFINFEFKTQNWSWHHVWPDFEIRPRKAVRRSRFPQLHARRLGKIGFHGFCIQHWKLNFKIRLYSYLSFRVY